MRPAAGVVHVSGPGPNVPPAERIDVRVRDREAEHYADCCAGAAIYGRDHCTCWEPVFDLEQQPLEDGGEPPQEIPTRTKCCQDCAYRNGSPERAAGDGDWLVGLATGEGREFWCHQGVRRVVAFRHPDGRELPAGDGDYRPPLGPPEDPVVWKADGTVGERCAGWAALAAAAAAKPRNWDACEKCRAELEDADVQEGYCPACGAEL